MKKIADNKGQALVELALLLPLLLLILLGIVEFGRIFGAALTVNHGAREGARLAAVGALDSEIVSRVRAASSYLDNGSLVVEITPLENTRIRGGEVQVKVSYPVEIAAPFISAVTGETVTVEGVCSMRVE